MLKAFCDKCGESCNSSDSSARRFETLLKGKSTSIGVEATPLYEGLISGGNHICDECMPLLLIEAAKTFSKSGVMANYKETVSTAGSHVQLKSELAKRLEAVSKREKQVEDKLAEATKQITEATEQKKKDAEHIVLLLAQVRNLQNVNDTTKRLVMAAEEQNKIDKKDNPESVDRQRARSRIGVQK